MLVANSDNEKVKKKKKSSELQKNLKPYQCKQCSLTFVQRTHFENHVQTKHLSPESVQNMEKKRYQVHSQDHFHLP